MTIGHSVAFRSPISGIFQAFKRELGVCRSLIHLYSELKLKRRRRPSNVMWSLNGLSEHMYSHVRLHSRPIESTGTLHKHDLQLYHVANLTLHFITQSLRSCYMLCTASWVIHTVSSPVLLRHGQFPSVVCFIDSSA